MDTTKLTLHTKFQIGAVDQRIFGGFLEHMGRAVYEGVYEPKSAHADEHGFRKDVTSALRRLRMTTMRYPGGNFASGYHWQDGIGLQANRPVVRELAWQSTETNQFGTDEYIRLCRDMGWTPMLTVNMGTGTSEEARNWVEYCNSPVGTRFANLRAANGAIEPHNVRLWCLGNEMDGPWQIGHVPALEYAIRAQQAAKMMKDVDPGIETVACGTCSIDLPTYAEWDRTVLEYLGPYADYISLHRYVGNPRGNTADFLAVTNSIDRQIEEIDAVCRYVQARTRSKNRHFLCFDEWNVWYRTQSSEYMNGEGKVAPHLIEETYTLEDALVVAGFLNSFIRHANVVKIANLAQIVNVIAPLTTRGDELLAQTIFYPLEMISSRGEGTSLRVHTEGPDYGSEIHGNAFYIDSSAIFNDEHLHLFATNRSLSETAPVELSLLDRHILSLEKGEILSASSADACNTFEDPQNVTSRDFNNVTFHSGKVLFEMPPLSMVALTFKVE